MMMHKNNCNKLLLENRKNVTFTPNIPFLIRGPTHDKRKGFMSHGQTMTNVKIMKGNDDLFGNICASKNNILYKNMRE